MNTYLLCTDTQNGTERTPYVMRYESAEMTELFTVEQIAELKHGKRIRKGATSYVDMVAAARAVK